MTRRPNYGQQRAERDRAARAKSAAKISALRERAEQRKSDRDAEPDAPVEGRPGHHDPSEGTPNE